MAKKVEKIMFPQLSYKVSSPYGQRGKTKHCGWDSHAYLGEKIFAGKTGIVIMTGYDKKSGNIVTVYYPALKLYCSFAHLDKIFVKEGQDVHALTVIGTAGHTGTTIPNDSRGTHLHIEFGTKVTKYGYIPKANTINPNVLHWITVATVKKSIKK